MGKEKEDKKASQQGGDKAEPLVHDFINQGGKDRVAAALSRFQGDMQSIKKDGQNPFLKNKYASLDAIIDQTRKVLAEYGLSFIQQVNDKGVNTILYHESGQYFESGYKLIAPSLTKGISPAQAEGVAITYTKRYQLAGLLGISSDEDTDGQYGDNKDLKAPVKKKRKITAEAFSKFVNQPIDDIKKYAPYYDLSDTQQKVIDTMLKNS